MRRSVFLLAALCCAACSPKPDIIQVGPWFPPKSVRDVPVFSSREETSRPWGAIAIIHSERFPADDRSALDGQMRLARKLAAGAGADGVIIAEEAVTEEPGLNGVRPPEAFISALAFKYVTDISTSTR
ncbi:MAG TPA: hypothetical protein PL037_00145 [Elusimicrobiales bacterium]|nr:hypothetical protein [Elusimicrobiales bacterium]